ncbi:hypothetical protein DFH06DRAFT_1126075 [Mycena polygramma]|nr:hypothetical protein DFH06DRAFT_1126075 [Mycena polygramma]
MSLLHSTVPHVRASLPMDPKSKAAKRASCRPPPPPQKMSAYTAGPVKLLYRIDVQAEDNLVAALRRSGLTWTLHEKLNIPHCRDLEDCSICSKFIDHLAAALALPDEEMDSGSEEMDSDDEPFTDPMDLLISLMHLRSRMKAYDADLTDEKAMARLEGAMVELFGDKVDALTERDKAIEQQTILRAKLEQVQAALDELANTSQKHAEDREIERARVAVLAEKLDTAHTETCKLQVTLASDADAHRQFVEYHHLTVAEVKEQLARVTAERDVLKVNWEIESCTRDELTKTCQKLTEDSDRVGFAELRQRLDTALIRADGREHSRSRKRQRTTELPDASTQLPMSAGRARLANRVGTEDHSRPQNRRAALSTAPVTITPRPSSSARPPDSLWQTFSRMQKPTAHDDPTAFAKWMQFNSDVKIQGIPVHEGTVDLRDVRGYHQITTRVIVKQRGTWSNLYYRSLFAILHVLAIPWRYRELLQIADAQVAETPSLTPCAVAGGQMLTDIEMTRLLAAKGLTVQIADDTWQYCYKFVEAEAECTESHFGLDNILELLENIRQREAIDGRPPGLNPSAQDQYGKVNVPDKRRRD